MKISISNINANTTLKMGSRRIFTPQFKLQVLESYRKDSDCKGNQRATARKYNIHRRQIQKWLQCESILRSTVANSTDNNVKHQLTSIYHHKHTIPIISDKYHTNFIDNKHQSLASPKNCNGSTQLSFNLNTSKVPTLNIGENSANIPAQNILAITNCNRDLGTKSLYSCDSTISPLRPTAIGGDIERKSLLTTNLNSSTQTHHHYIPYTHTPSHVPISISALTHVIPNHYQYHNLPHIQSLQATQSTAYNMSSASLHLTDLSDETTNPKKFELKDANIKSEKLDYDLLHEKKYFPILSKNSHYECDDHIFDCGTNIYRIKNSSVDPKMTPMDLSLGIRHKIFERNKETSLFYSKKLETIEDTYLPKDPHFKGNFRDNLVVDLTLRKRKNVLINETICKNENKQPKILAVDEENSIKSFQSININTSFEHSTDKVNNTDAEVNFEQESLAAKPIKLFKPYLLDEEENKCNKTSLKLVDIPSVDQQDTIIWSNHPECLSSHIYESENEYSKDINFHLSNFQKSTFPSGCDFFHERKSISPQSAFSSPTATGISSNIFRCPKESPVSGYESCSSTYSESSSRSETFTISNNRAYSIDLQMQTIFNISSQQMHVRNWLDQDSKMNSSDTPNNQIVLYA